MANITAAEVNKLRQQTGAGMMDCKKALVESDGDFEKAVDFLRKKGQKVASNRADRDAKDGIVIAKISDDAKKGIVIMLNCETDFVAKSADFVKFASDILETAFKNKVKNLDELNASQIEGRTISEKLMDIIGKTGEKCTLAHCEIIDAAKVIAYNHPGNRLATIVGFNKDGGTIDAIGKDIAMQIAAMAPVAIDKDAVDSKIIEREIEIGKEQARQEGKPEEMLEKIATGKLAKFFKENTLLNQEFIKDSKKTVAQYMAENDKDLQVVSFKRLMLGA
jgi:elongation factor Ts